MNDFQALFYNKNNDCYILLNYLSNFIYFKSTSLGTTVNSATNVKSK